MTELIEVAGSFSTIWLGTWFASSLVLVAAYPLLRTKLTQWHPAIAANFLLLLLSFPFLLSLSSSLLLFMPAIENLLVSDHCHENCQAHLPLVEIPWLTEIGLLLIALVLTVLLRRLLSNLRASRQLHQQLQALSRPSQSGQYSFRLLDNETPFVFTLGWWKNEVYLTSGLQASCSQQDLNIICAHEAAHSARRDNIRLLMANLFLFPLPQVLASSLQQDLHLMIESACDFQAAERHDRLDVAQTLVRVQKMSPRLYPFGTTMIASAFTGAEIEHRVQALVAGREQSIYQHAGLRLSVLMLILFSISLVDPMHHGIETLLSLH